MLCSHCLGLVLRSVIRATQYCLTVQPYCLFGLLLIVTVIFDYSIKFCKVKRANTFVHSWTSVVPIANWEFAVRFAGIEWHQVCGRVATGRPALREIRSWRPTDGRLEWRRRTRYGTGPVGARWPAFYKATGVSGAKAWLPSPARAVANFWRQISVTLQYFHCTSIHPIKLFRLFSVPCRGDSDSGSAGAIMGHGSIGLLSVFVTCPLCPKIQSHV